MAVSTSTRRQASRSKPKLPPRGCRTARAAGAARGVQQRADVAGPADRHHRAAEREFQDQVPADDPGRQLAEGGVARRCRRIRRPARWRRTRRSTARRGAQTTPATTKASATAGPACSLATLPVSTKMPVPMMTPTPKTVRSSADSDLRERVLRLLGVPDGLLDGLGAEQAATAARIVRCAVLCAHRRTSTLADPRNSPN